MNVIRKYSVYSGRKHVTMLAMTLYFLYFLTVYVAHPMMHVHSDHSRCHDDQPSIPSQNTNHHTDISEVCQLCHVGTIHTSLSNFDVVGEYLPQGEKINFIQPDIWVALQVQNSSPARAPPIC